MNKELRFLPKVVPMLGLGGLVLCIPGNFKSLEAWGFILFGNAIISLLLDIRGLLLYRHDAMQELIKDYRVEGDQDRNDAS